MTNCLLLGCGENYDLYEMLLELWRCKDCDKLFNPTT